MNNRKIYIWVSIITILGLLAFLTYAWVRGQQYSNIDDSDVAVSVGNNIEVSLTGAADSFGDAVNLDLNQVALQYVGGNGFDFYKPDEGTPYYDSTTGWSAATSGTDYIKFDLYFRAPTDVDLYLSKKSYILPSTTKRQIGNDATVLTVNDIVNRSTNRPFTRDYVAGASRLVILSENEEVTSEIESEKYALTKLWIPNTTYRLYDTGGSNWVVDENSSNMQGEGPNYYMVTKDESNIFRSGTFASGITTTALNAYRNKSNGDNAFASIIGTNNSNLVTKHIVVKIWVDGTDREATDMLAGGDIKINLQFVGIKRG